VLLKRGDKKMKLKEIMEMAHMGIIRSTQGILPNGTQFNVYEAYMHNLLTSQECKEAIDRYYNMGG
jgi:hypothetical protein